MNESRGPSMSRRKVVGTAVGGLASIAGISQAKAASKAFHPIQSYAASSQKLQIAFVGTQLSPTDKSVAKGFEQKFPDAKVEFLPIQGKDWNEYFSKILTMMATGTVPDLMSVATEGTQLFAGKKLSTPIDDYVKKDAEAMKEYFADVHPSLVEAMMYEGSLYQLPQDFNAANMYLNTKLLQANGLEYPAAEWTKDDFYNYAKKMTKSSGGPPFGYGWVNRLWGGWMPWIFVNGSNLLTEERAPGGEWLWSTFYPNDPSAKQRGGGWRWLKPQANAAANVEALDFVVQLSKEKLNPTVSAGGGDLLQGFFTSNNLGLTPAGGFWAGGLHNAGMKADGFDVQLFPKWKSQRHQFGTAGLVMMEKSGAKDLAWEYMKYYVSKSTMAEIFKGNPTTPVRRSMMTAEQYASTGPKHWQVFYDTLDKHPDTAPIPAPPQSNEMTSIFMKYTGLAVTFAQDSKQALDNMQKDLEDLFSKPIS